jgi:hypothetical protein
MDTSTIILFASVAVLTFVGWLIYDQHRTKHLQERFGPEYDRTVMGIGDRRVAESELEHREQHARELKARPINFMDRQRFLSRWKRCQSQFVDDPAGAVDEAEQVVTDVMRTRGYSTDNPYDRMTDIAAAYPHHAERYRQAGQILAQNSRTATSTKELRTAFLYYRSLFEDLIGENDEELQRAS